MKKLKFTACVAFAVIYMLTVTQKCQGLPLSYAEVTTPGGIGGNVEKPEAYIDWYDTMLMSREALKGATLEDLDLPVDLYACTNSDDDTRFEYVKVEWDLTQFDINASGTYILPPNSQIPGGNDDKDNETDGGSSGKRGGGGRYGENIRNKEISVTKKQLQNYIKLNPVQTIMQADDIKIALPTEVMKLLSKETNKSIDITVSTAEEGMYILKLMIDGTASADFGGEIIVCFPYEADTDDEWNSIAVIHDGEDISFTADREAGCVAVNVFKTGIYEIRAEDKLADSTQWNGAIGWLKYLWLMMTGQSLK